MKRTINEVGQLFMDGYFNARRIGGRSGAAPTGGGTGGGTTPPPNP